MIYQHASDYHRFSSLFLGAMCKHFQTAWKRSTVFLMKAPDEARRRFLKTIATAPVLPALAADVPQADHPRVPLNAIQMGQHTMLDEGIERCLDLIQDTAA